MPVFIPVSHANNSSVISEGSPEFEEETDGEISKNKSTLGCNIEKSMHRNRKSSRENELWMDQYLCFRFIPSGTIMNPKYGKVKTSTSISTHSRSVSKRTHSVAQKQKKYGNISWVNATKNHELLN